MSSLTSAGFTATQYALFSSLYSLLGKLIASQSGRIVESSAQSAEAGGMFGALKRPVRAPAGRRLHARRRHRRQPAALGSGYVVFFIYSALIGVAGVVLAIMIAARSGRRAVERRQRSARLGASRRVRALGKAGGDSEQAGGVDRLGDEIVHAGLAGADALLLAGVGGQRHDRRARGRPLPGADALGGLEAVEPRHADVEQDEIVGRGGGGGDRLLAVPAPWSQCNRRA